MSVRAPGRYARLPLPGQPTFTAHARQPAQYLGRLLTDRLRQGMPATRRVPVVHVLLARFAGPVVAMAARVPLGRPEPDLDELVGLVQAAWPRLGVRGGRLPGDSPTLETLAVDGAMGRITFLFAGADHPLVVGKTPAGPRATAVQNEVDALERLALTGVAPHHLGKVGTTQLQEGLPGRPLPLQDLGRQPATWTTEMAAALRGLLEVTRATAEPGVPDELDDVESRLATAGGLESRTRARASEALRRAAGHGATVLRHGDLSPQNVLCSGGRLTGIIDWERATTGGVAGFDLLHLAVSWIEKGIGSGTRRWTAAGADDRFAASWQGAFRDHVLERVGEALTSAGVDAGETEDMEVAFFARRFARRLAPTGYRHDALELAARNLETVCAR